MSNFEYFTAKVYNIIQETPKIRRFFIEFPELETFEHKAGQYIKINMPIEGKKTYRQYSIASEPIGDNKIELLIVQSEHGLGTEYLFNTVSIGSSLQVSSALGRFLLPEKIDKDICFICTGVGLAPFRAMYQEIINKNLNPEKHNINLIFGTRAKEDLCYFEELTNIVENNDYFHYYPVLSRENPNEWTGKTGYVHQIYKELYSNHIQAVFYICGWEVMIREAKNTLKEMGYDKKQIHFEKYD